MALQPWAEALATTLQEQATQLSHNNIRACLNDALKTCFPGQYCYCCDVFGDDESGDLVYSCSGDYKRCQYEISMVNGKRVCALDTDAAVDVMPRTVYDEEADEADHMAGMQEGHRLNVDFFERFPGSENWKAPVTERFISKSERDAMDPSDFAGKGKSFPIKKPGDIMAAVRSMGRAGSDNKSPGALKSSIIRIAKKKGWAKYLPKAWQSGGDTSEAARAETGDVLLTESAATVEQIVLKEARADYEIKLIAPGKGSSAYYPREVLKRDGPTVFKAGTHVYLNHATATEESERPEGDVRNLAGVLTTNAYYSDNHKMGEGLYGRMKVFSDHAQTVEEKAPHVGMSIRARGAVESGTVKEGRPVLKSLSAADSVDVVTRAGAGGMILTEAARPQPTEGELDMDEAQVKKLIESATAPLLAKIAEYEKPKLGRGKAIRKLLEGVRIPETAKKIIERAVKANFPLTEAGAIDDKRLRERVNEELALHAQLLSEATGRVVNLGVSAAVTTTPQQLQEADARFDEEFKESINDLADIFTDTNVETPRDIAKQRRKMFREGRAA